jgi:hypothetical protein
MSSSDKRKDKTVRINAKIIKKLDKGDNFIFKFAQWGVESILVPLGTSATSGLLYLAGVIVRMENLVE